MELLLKEEGYRIAGSAMEVYIRVYSCASWAPFPSVPSVCSVG